METTKLRRFAQHARTVLKDIVKSKLALVLLDNSSARREYPKAIQQLLEEIEETSKEQIVEKVAYIWFNRFIALRFMDVNRYTKINIVSPEPGQFQPSILSDAKMGHVDDSLVSESVKEKVLALLENRTPSKDPQGEAYKLLVVSACNYYSYAMPFLFEKIADYTELLMPDDLLSGSSILSYVREAMTPDICKMSDDFDDENVQVIGWLYQFYISEKKDEVFEGIKHNKKVTPENIPAATQLFTPHWIVRYMVENSLGRLWMLNNPNSKLAEKMDYYIKPETPESDYLKISSPTELKVCDPACGSGHILVYAFDLLYEIYKEEGIDESIIAEQILKYNLFGIEIDERAAELAAFALTMKAASKAGSKRRFFRDPIAPNIRRLENISFSDDEIRTYMDAIGRDIFTSDIQTTLKQFEESDNFGSLIIPAVKDVTVTLKILEEKDVSHDLFLAPTHEKVLQVLKQADYLSQKYHVVVANPPFMGSKSHNPLLKSFLTKNYKDYSKNVYSAFIIRAKTLSVDKGLIGYVTPFTWLSISSYEKLRYEILTNMGIVSLVKPSYTAFFEMATVQFVSFILINEKKDFTARYFDLGYLGTAEDQPRRLKDRIYNKTNDGVFVRSAKDFIDIPGNPIAFSLSDQIRKAFVEGQQLSNLADFRQGLATGENNRFLRIWSEISFSKLGLGFSSTQNFHQSHKKWVPYNKGGGFKKWYGNAESVLAFDEENYEILSKQGNNLPSRQYYFRESITWSLISSYSFGARKCNQGFVFDVGGSSAFVKDTNMNLILGLLSSKLSTIFLQALNPTANMQVGDVASIPYLGNKLNTQVDKIIMLVEKMVNITKNDWDSYETSWDFASLPLLQSEYKNSSLEKTYQSLRSFWQFQVDEMKKFEEENNDIFIKAYGLEDELTPEVPLKEITLICNPYYRYDAKKSEEELEALLKADTMREFVSYAVGVMLGRYSLDHDRLYIANQNESIEEANAKFGMGNPTFEADDDNVIPVLDGEWFTDDISERFFNFVKVTFGEKYYDENINFIANALSDKNNNSVDTIRKYFLKGFYEDHVKRYKKRPIYWMFSSSKGSFQCLVYMHRYKSDTVSVILNDYLRNFITKLEATKDNLEAVDISANASKNEKTKALKEIEKIKKMLIELEEYEKDILYPLAMQKKEIDLDEGVKYNYPLFGKALKKVTGLD